MLLNNKLALYSVVLLSIPAALAASVGKITATNGDVFVVSGAQKEKKASAGLELDVGDSVKSAKGATAQIVFQDKTVITVGAATTFKVSDYLDDGSNSRAKFNVSEGSFKTVTGKIAKLAPEKFKVETKTATIGIRGTIFIGNVLPTGETLVACSKGAITVAPIMPVGVIPPPPVIVRQGEITKAFAQSVEAPRPYTPAEMNNLQKDLGGKLNPDKQSAGFGGSISDMQTEPITLTSVNTNTFFNNTPKTVVEIVQAATNTATEQKKAEILTEQAVGLGSNIIKLVAQVPDIMDGQIVGYSTAALFLNPKAGTYAVVGGGDSLSVGKFKTAADGSMTLYYPDSSADTSIIGTLRRGTDANTYTFAYDLQGPSVPNMPTLTYTKDTTFTQIPGSGTAQMTGFAAEAMGSSMNNGQTITINVNKDTGVATADATSALFGSDIHFGSNGFYVNNSLFGASEYSDTSYKVLSSRFLYEYITDTEIASYRDFIGSLDGVATLGYYAAYNQNPLYGAYVAGIRTPVASMPSNIVANYSGYVGGMVSYDGMRDQILLNQNNRALFSILFGSNTGGYGSLSFDDSSGRLWRANVNNLAVSSGMIGTSNISTGDGATVTDLSGIVMGGFYGSGALALGGVYGLSGTYSGMPIMAGGAFLSAKTTAVSTATNPTTGVYYYGGQVQDDGVVFVNFKNGSTIKYDKSAPLDTVNSVIGQINLGFSAGNLQSNGAWSASNIGYERTDGFYSPASDIYGLYTGTTTGSISLGSINYNTTLTHSSGASGTGSGSAAVSPLLVLPSKTGSYTMQGESIGFLTTKSIFENDDAGPNGPETMSSTNANLLRHTDTDSFSLSVNRDTAAMSGSFSLTDTASASTPQDKLIISSLGSTDKTKSAYITDQIFGTSAMSGSYVGETFDKGIFVTLPSAPQNGNDMLNDDYVSWGYWQTMNANKVAFGYWVGGERTPAATMSQLASSGVTSQYNGFVIGSAVGGAGSPGYDEIVQNSSNYISFSVNFGSNIPTAGSISFDTTKGKQYRGSIQNLSNPAGTNGFTASVANISGGNTTINSGSLHGNLYGPTANVAAGSFGIGGTDGSNVAGVFKTKKQQ